MKTPIIERVSDMRDIFAPMAFPPVGATRLFGNLIEQAGRQQLVTAVTVSEALDILQHPKQTQAQKQANLAEVDAKTNRPTEPAHIKKLRDYIVKAVKRQETFILPAIIANYGLEGNASTDNEVRVYAVNMTAGNGHMAAALVMPTDPELRMQITDGAHRLNVLLGLIADKDKALTEVEKAALKALNIPLVVVFETSLLQAHQDFADCSKTKPITKDLAIAYDARDKINTLTRALVARGKWATRVDFTASNVNLRVKSKNLFTAQAMKLFTKYLWEAKLVDSDSVDYLADFWDTIFDVFCYASFDDQAELEKARVWREGDVSLRAAACGLFARAYAEAVTRKIDPKAVVKAMANLDWCVLPQHPEDAAYAEKGGYYKALLQLAGENGELDEVLRKTPELINPLFADLVVAGKSRMKLSSTTETLDRSWDVICAAIFGADKLGEPAHSRLDSVRLTVDGATAKAA